MFNLFNKTHKIIFKTITPAILDKYSPDDGRKDLIDIFKKIIPRSDNTSIKKCPGIIDYCKQGYIIRAWQDIKIKTNQDAESYQWSTPYSTDKFLSKELNNLINYDIITGMGPDLFYNYFPKNNTLKTVLKINTPWFIELPKNYKALFLPVWYDNESRFSTIPGILDPILDSRINIQLYWHELGKENIIKAGTPLVKIIPFKNDNWEIESREINQTEAKKIKSYFFNLHNGIN